MASFTITAPLALDDVKTVVQDDSPDFSRTTRTFDASSPEAQSFVATTIVDYVNYSTGITLPMGQPNKMVNISVRPSTGQVYPRTI